ncbi:MAG: hypothetical protein ABEL51_14475 [Salinibacter sp.]
MDARSLGIVMIGYALLVALVIALLDVPFPGLFEPSGTSPVVITEVQLNPPCAMQADACAEWVEVGNTTDKAIPLTTWFLSTSEGGVSDTIALMASGCPPTLPAESHCVIKRPGWLDRADERVILNGLTARHFYQTITPLLSDDAGDGRSWQRCPVVDDWRFRRPTPGEANRCL